MGVGGGSKDKYGVSRLKRRGWGKRVRGGTMWVGPRGPGRIPGSRDTRKRLRGCEGQ